MAVFPVIVDAQPAFMGGGGAPSHSLLATPLGNGTILEHIAGCVAGVTHESITVLVPTNGRNGSGLVAADELGKAGAVGVSSQQLASLLNTYEPSDMVLVINPRCFPADGFDFTAIMPDSDTQGWVRHLIALEDGGVGTKEYAMLDRHGHVQKIQRYYDGVTWLNTSGVACSLIPISCARLVDGNVFESPTDLRRTLAAFGVPCQDVSVRGEILDLAQERGLLNLSERVLLADTSRPARAPNVALGVDIHAGPRCRIDPGARLYGPVIIQDEAVVEEGAAIIGPALIGTGARIGSGAVVAQCLVSSGASITEGMAVRHRVVVGRISPDCQARIRGVPMPLPVLRPTRSALIDPQASLAGPNGKVRTRFYTRMKRLIDLTVSLLGLLVLSPLMISSALFIKLTSRGSVLFAHEREGRGGMLFRCWKFRTMVHNAHAQQRELYKRNALDGPQFKLDRDPRVTWVGNSLRRTNVDELPQLLNVVAGQMSLIGPRPSPFRENQICVPWRMARLSVRPGITGLWQVCRHDRAHGDFHQWIYYDMLYVRHMSWWLDVKILLATLLTLGGRWGVPLSWMIPKSKLQPELDASNAVSWTPVVPLRSASGMRQEIGSPAAG